MMFNAFRLEAQRRALNLPVGGGGACVGLGFVVWTRRS